MSVSRPGPSSKMVKVSSKMLGVKLHSLTGLYKRQLMGKAKAILSVGAHPLHSVFQLLPSGSRFRFQQIQMLLYPPTRERDGSDVLVMMLMLMVVAMRFLVCLLVWTG